MAKKRRKEVAPPSRGRGLIDTVVSVVSEIMLHLVNRPPYLCLFLLILLIGYVLASWPHAMVVALVQAVFGAPQFWVLISASFAAGFAVVFISYRRMREFYSRELDKSRAETAEWRKLACSEVVGSTEKLPDQSRDEPQAMLPPGGRRSADGEGESRGEQETAKGGSRKKGKKPEGGSQRGEKK